MESEDFIYQFVSKKVKEWVFLPNRLSDIAVPHPQSAFAAYTHGVFHKWSYLSRTCSGIDYLFHPLEDTISNSFIPALTGKDSPNGQLRNLLALPSQLGGLGLQNPCSLSVSQNTASVNITSPLVHAILGESNDSAGEIQRDQLLIREHKKKKSTEAKNAAQSLRTELPAGLQKQMDCASEQGASSWVTVIPIQDQNSILTSLISRMLLS